MSALTADDLEGPESGRPVRHGPHWRRNATLAVIGLVLAVGVAVYMAFGGRTAGIEAHEVGFTVHGPESITLDFTVTKPEDATVDCTVEALATDFSQVGLTTVTVPASTTAQQDVTVTVPTTQTAVSAVVRSCVVPD